MKYDADLRRAITGWDVRNWGRALSWWDRFLPEDAGRAPALEIGAREGGLSVYLALHNYGVVCSDIDSPENSAGGLHRQLGLADRIEYAECDVTDIEYADGSLSVVAVKSVLGGVGRDDQPERIERAISEFMRVLEPGGCLLYAENLAGSLFHRILRRKFQSWGRYWYYPTIEEIWSWLSCFSSNDCRTVGFLGTLGRREWQREILGTVDLVLDRFLPVDSRYLIYGCARK